MHFSTTVERLEYSFTLAHEDWGLAGREEERIPPTPLHTFRTMDSSSGVASFFQPQFPIYLRGKDNLCFFCNKCKTRELCSFSVFPRALIVFLRHRPY